MSEMNYMYGEQYPLHIEYTPFDQKRLESYLKQSLEVYKILQERRKQIREDMERLLKGIDADGMTLEERISAYAYPGKSMDTIGGSSGGHCDPDTLFRQYLKIYYEPFEPQMKILLSRMARINYEQMQLEKINQCVEALPPLERDIIITVLINNVATKEYCSIKNMGRTKFQTLKVAALKQLLVSCNKSLKELHDIWVKRT